MNCDQGLHGKGFLIHSISCARVNRRNIRLPRHDPMIPPHATPPAIVDFDADARFRLACRAIGHDPANPWLERYVEYEWEHVRHIGETATGSFAGANTLEFGCNIGATAIVLATLGAKVTALDADASIISIAGDNIARYGLTGRIELVWCENTRTLPFPDAYFDRIVCNSVLEYIAPPDLPSVQREIDRVLKPGGLVFVVGTSNRLAPREVHSKKWLVNYWPTWLDRWLGDEDTERGVSPWRVRHGFGAYENLDWADRGEAYIEARRRMSKSGVRRLRAAHRVARLLGVTLGLLTPSISVTLRKPLNG